MAEKSLVISSEISTYRRQPEAARGKKGAYAPRDQLLSQGGPWTGCLRKNRQDPGAHATVGDQQLHTTLHIFSPWIIVCCLYMVLFISFSL